MKREDILKKTSVIIFISTSTIGVANFCRLPYEISVNGGGSFLLTYLLFILLVGVPVFFAELVIGKNGKSDVVTSIEKLSLNKKTYSVAGKIGMISSFFALAFYLLIASWALIYLYEGILYGYSSYEPKTSAIYFNQRINSFSLGIFAQVASMFLIIVKINYEPKKLFNKLNKYICASFLIVGILLFTNTIYLLDLNKVFEYLFVIDYRYLNNNLFDILFIAMRQSIFSLSIGFGIIITYGKYIKNNYNTSKISLSVVLINTLASMLFIIILFTVIDAYGVSYGNERNVMFIALLVLFGQSTVARILGSIFFLTLFIIIILSSRALMQNIVFYFENVSNIKSQTVAYIIGFLTFLISIFLQSKLGVSFSLLEWTGGVSLNEQLIVLVLDILLPLAALTIILFTGFKLNPVFIQKEIRNKRLVKMYIMYMRYILPLIIGILFTINFLSLVG